MTNRSTLLLEHHLKELRLPTFLREYRKLAAQCALPHLKRYFKKVIASNKMLPKSREAITWREA